MCDSSDFFDSESFEDSDTDTIVTNSITSNDFYQQMQNNSKMISEIFDIHEDIAFVCLESMRWNYQKVLDELSINKKEFLKQLGFEENNYHEKQTLHKLITCEPSECQICFEKVQPEKMCALSCNHFFCLDCWKEHCEQMNKNGSSHVFCMECGCKRKLLLSDIVNLCGRKTADMMKERLKDVSVNISREFKKCINPKCDLSIGLDALGLCNVAKCSCGTRICWKCGEKAHAPLKCSDIQKWNNLIGNESNMWISFNTKQCPKCHMRIEKTGGCNHMVCSSCKYEFCWICEHEWKTHDKTKYQCNQYIKETVCGAEDVEDEERLVHYCKHYFSLYNSIQEEQSQRKIQREKMFCNFKKSGNAERKDAEINRDIDFIFAAIDEALSVLMWSYPYSYFLGAKNTNLNLFEFVQAECQNILEKLCFSVQYQTNIFYDKILSLSKTLRRNIETLLKHVDSYQQ